MRTPAPDERGSLVSAASAARRAAARSRKDSGRARSRARASVTNELTRARLQSGPPEREHRQRVRLRGGRALGDAAVDEPVEGGERVSRELAQVGPQPALDRRGETLLGPA